MTECSGWAEMPQDVFQHLVTHLETKGFCTLRLVSRTWASCSRHITTPPMVILSSGASLSVKIATLASWRQAGRFANSKFSFQIDEPMSLLGLRRTIKALTEGRLTNCKINVQLQHASEWNLNRADNLKNLKQHLENANQIAEFAQQLLHENGVKLCITMQRRSEDIYLPPRGAMSRLRRFLCVFDTYSIPTEQPAASLPQWQDDFRLSCLSHKQVSALKHSNTQICTLQVEIDPEDDQKAQDGQWSYAMLVADVATMMHLTKLHLSLCDVFDIKEVDLEPLACLTLLEDLALQYCDSGEFVRARLVCCQGVLKSNKSTLRCVTLTGPWTLATYNALKECSKLEILSISISQLDIDQARAFTSISADSFRLTLHQQLEPSVLAAIKDTQPQVHMLTVWGMYNEQALRLPQLLSLQELTLVNFVPFMVISGEEPYPVAAYKQGYRPFTGEDFECCPMVTQLTLIDCPGINSKGLQHIIEKALPALQALSIWASKKSDPDFVWDCACTFDADSLHALCLGSNLRSIDLRGVSGLTAELLSWFKVALHLKQCQGDAPSSIELLLPHAACFAQAVYSVRTEWTMFLPNILTSSGCGDAELIVVS